MIDVSELIDDADFSDHCILVRTALKREENGRDTPSSEETELTAIIQPATAEQLTALSGLTSGRLIEALQIWSKERLSAGGDGQLSDSILYQGVSYDVTSVDDYTAVGGFCHALIARTGSNDRFY